jgi:predicted site-specific integrase-resolvase
MQLYNISDSTLARYRKEDKIPFTRLGGRFLYPKHYFTKSLMEKMENKHLL